MTVRSQLLRVLAQEDINFLLTNRVPRRLLTQFIGWWSRIEQPQIRDLSIGLWRVFADIDFSEAKKSQFRSLHDCFIRELKDGARRVDRRPEILVSPCDAIVGACGAVAGTEVLQAKGFPYSLAELLCDPDLVDAHRNGRYITLRLTASMYHRFHAPHDVRLEKVIYVSGDTWNVNPIALTRVEQLFCKNERAVLPMRLGAGGYPVTLVPVAAILVASLRLRCLDVPLNLRHRGQNVIPCDAYFSKGEELGWFEQGSTIIVFVPDGFTLCDQVCQGAVVRVGEPLMRLP